MLHPSYTDLMKEVNRDVEQGEQLVVNSRYSIVLATAKRARQIIDGSKPSENHTFGKPLSIAVEEIYKGKVKIVTEEEYEELKLRNTEQAELNNDKDIEIGYEEPNEELNMEFNEEPDEENN